MTYEILIDGKSAAFSITGERFTYHPQGGDGMEGNCSAAPLGDGAWSILIDGRSYAVAVLSAKEVSVDGRVFQVEASDPRGPRGRLTASESSGPQSVVTPITGRVVHVLVEPGQEVEAGQGLIVVEAMKMQNEMKARRAGRVVTVETKAGATVSAGDVLVVIE